MKRGNRRIFGRETQQRKAFIRTLLTVLVTHGRVRTTVARAKTIKTRADKLVTRAKYGTVASRRILMRHVGSATATKLMADVAEKFVNRHGGYTRVVNLGRRLSDGSPMALIEFVS